MRNYVRHLSALVILALPILATAQHEGARADRTPAARRPEHVSSYTGDVLIRTRGARILVMLDTAPDPGTPGDGVVDQWFVLETADPLLVPLSETLDDALLVYSNDQLEVASQDRRFVFALEGDAADDARIVGVGLSHHKGAKTGVRIADERQRGRVATTCEACDVLDPDPGAGSGGTTACSSGGPGATQCSVTQGANSCSITCASGRYACGNYGASGSPYCRCVSG